MLVWLVLALVLPHLDGLQPLVHRVKAGVVRDRAVQQWQVDSRGWGGRQVRSVHVLT